MITVPVKIAGQAFQCSPLADVDFTNKESLYVVICVAPGGSWTVLDVGEADELTSRKSQWGPSCPNQNVWVCYYSLPDPGSRREFKEVVRKQYDPPSGKKS